MRSQAFCVEESKTGIFEQNKSSSNTGKPDNPEKTDIAIITYNNGDNLNMRNQDFGGGDQDIMNVSVKEMP